MSGRNRHATKDASQATKTYHRAVARTRETREAGCRAVNQAAPAIDVYQAYLAADKQRTVLVRGQHAVCALIRAAPQTPKAPEAEAVRESLIEALSRQSPKFLGAFIFVQGLGDLARAVALLQGSAVSARGAAYIGASHHLLHIWHERMYDVQAALAYAKSLPTAVIEEMTGPVGDHAMQLHWAMHLYIRGLMHEVVSWQSGAHKRAIAPFTPAQQARLTALDEVLALSDMPALSEGIVGSAANDMLHRAHERALLLCESIDLSLLRSFYQSANGLRFKKHHSRLSRQRQHDLATLVAASLSVLGADGAAAYSALADQMSSATLAAKASISTGLRK